MSERKWTPGPWKASKYAGEISGKSGELIVSRTSGPIDNAHLIAAAPELYEALESARFYLSYHYDDDALSNLDAALAKARGEA